MALGGVAPVGSQKGPGGEVKGRTQEGRGAIKPRCKRLTPARPAPLNEGGAEGVGGGRGYHFKRVSKSLGRRLPSLYLHSQ